jgi:hypothetical protein
MAHSRCHAIVVVYDWLGTTDMPVLSLAALAWTEAQGTCATHTGGLCRKPKWLLIMMRMSRCDATWPTAWHRAVLCQRLHHQMRPQLAPAPADTISEVCCSNVSICCRLLADVGVNDGLGTSCSNFLQTYDSQY